MVTQKTQANRGNEILNHGQENENIDIFACVFLCSVCLVWVKNCLNLHDNTKKHKQIEGMTSPEGIREASGSLSYSSLYGNQRKKILFLELNLLNEPGSKIKCL